MAHVLFVCLHNAGRSQMSQALFERAAAGLCHSCNVSSKARWIGSRTNPLSLSCQSYSLNVLASAARSSCKNFCRSSMRLPPSGAGWV